jgi:hypothetical protein
MDSTINLFGATRWPASNKRLISEFRDALPDGLVRLSSAKSANNGPLSLGERELRRHEPKCQKASSAALGGQIR